MPVFLRRFIFIGLIVSSIAFNAVLVVSDVAYGMFYGLLSNLVSMLYEGAELTKSTGWKRSQLEKDLKKSRSELNDSKKESTRKSERIRRLGHEKSNLEAKNIELFDRVGKGQTEISRLNEKRLFAEKKIADLVKDNSSLKSELSINRKNLIDLKSELASKYAKEINPNPARPLVKHVEKRLVKRSSKEMVDLIKSARIIQEATDKVKGRISKRVARNIAALPFESVPAVGIAVSVGTIYLEIQDACTTLAEFDDMTASLGVDQFDSSYDSSFCSFTKEDLMRIVFDRGEDFDKCVKQFDVNNPNNVEDLIKTCLPVEVEILSIPKVEKFIPPNDAKL